MSWKINDEKKNKAVIIPSNRKDFADRITLKYCAKKPKITDFFEEKSTSMVDSIEEIKLFFSKSLSLIGK